MTDRWTDNEAWGMNTKPSKDSSNPFKYRTQNPQKAVQKPVHFQNQDSQVNEITKLTIVATNQYSLVFSQPTSKVGLHVYWKIYQIIYNCRLLNLNVLKGAFKFGCKVGQLNSYFLHYFYYLSKIRIQRIPHLLSVPFKK